MRQLPRITIDDESYQYSLEFVNNNNIANRGEFDGSKRNQFVGILGQVMLYKYLFGKLPELESGFDNGIDLVYNDVTIDVKTMERKGFMRDYYVNNFVASQGKYETQVLIFLNYNSVENIIEICGWIFKKDLFYKGEFYKKGTKRYRSDGSYFINEADMFEIPQRNLKHFEK